MMKKGIFLAFLLLNSMLRAQDTSRWMSDFQLYSGFNVVGLFNTFSLNDLPELIPEASSFAQVNYLFQEDHYAAGDYGDDSGLPLNFYLNASFGHRLKNPMRHWRTGLNYSLSDIEISSISLIGNQQFDFSYSDSNKMIGYSDSLHSYYSKFGAKFQKISIENELVHRSDPSKKIGGYLGFSTQLGIVVPTYSYFNRSELEINRYDSLEHKTLLSHKLSESSFSKTGSVNPFCSVNFVFGYDIKLTTKRKSTTGIHIFSEFKPGVCFIYVSELKKLRSSYNGYMSFIGFRFTFGETIKTGS